MQINKFPKNIFSRNILLQGIKMYLENRVKLEFEFMDHKNNINLQYKEKCFLNSLFIQNTSKIFLLLSLKTIKLI